jgi:hypothetical protein
MSFKCHECGSTETYERKYGEYSDFFCKGCDKCTRHPVVRGVIPAQYGTCNKCGADKVADDLFKAFAGPYCPRCNDWC